MPSCANIGQPHTVEAGVELVLVAGEGLCDVAAGCALTSPQVLSPLHGSCKGEMNGLLVCDWAGISSDSLWNPKPPASKQMTGIAFGNVALLGKGKSRRLGKCPSTGLQARHGSANPAGCAARCKVATPATARYLQNAILFGHTHTPNRSATHSCLLFKLFRQTCEVTFSAFEGDPQNWLLISV